MQPTEFTLILESFDQNSSVKSTLKTDYITIIVSDDLPYFTTDLELQNLVVGESFEWDLPDIEEGSVPLSEVLVEPDAAIYNQISYSKS